MSFEYDSVGTSEAEYVIGTSFIGNRVIIASAKQSFAVTIAVIVIVIVIVIVVVVVILIIVIVAAIIVFRFFWLLGIARSVAAATTAGTFFGT